MSWLKYRPRRDIPTEKGKTNHDQRILWSTVAILIIGGAIAIKWCSNLDETFKQKARQGTMGKPTLYNRILDYDRKDEGDNSGALGPEEIRRMMKDYCITERGK